MLKIFKSSAGSGKTYTLVKEFLLLSLKQPDKYKHILAITFTNKAANEMKERIILALEQIKNRHEKVKKLTEELAEELAIDNDEVVKRAGNVLRSILHNYSDISVSTIDSFTHRIIRSFAHDLHLPMNFEVEMDRDKLLNETIEILMDRLSEEDDQVTNAIVEFAESNIEEGKSWNLEHSLVNLGKELFNEDAYPHLEKLAGVEFSELRQQREALNKFIALFEAKLFAEGKKAFDLILNSGLTSKHFYYGDKGIFGFFSKYANGEFPNAPVGNSYVLKTISEDKWTGSKLSEADLQMVEGVKSALTIHYNNIAESYSKQGSDFELARLLLRNFYSFILLTDIQKLMNEYKKENNILHISEFQKKIHAIVKEQDAPIIYERIGEWYDNILIDEHQDTSELQWQNLLPLIENSQFKSEDSLVVGDGKQAIYRFRNGKVEQFAMLPDIYGSDKDMLLKEREVAIQNYGTELHNLAFNYRSRKEVVNFNNRFYDTLSELPELKNKSIYLDHAQKQGRNEEGGYVSIEFLNEEENDLDEQRCRRVEEIIESSKNKGYSLKDIAVLTRSNIHGTIIASYLIEKGIPVVSSESLLINNSPKVQLILSTLNYFDQKENHIARAEMVYYIHLLLLKKEFRFEQFNFKSSDTAFEENISKLLSKEFHTYDFISYSLVDLLHELSVFYGLMEEDPFLQFFLDEAMVFASRNRSNIREFLGWWNEVKYNRSIIYPETLDAVKIMTLHKSKGLQFPVVIMADADWPQKNSKKNFWINIDKPWLKGFHTGILPVSKDVLETEYATLYEEEDANSFLDLLNLVYVGTTRPEDMLYILSTEPKKEPEKNNSVTALLINFLKLNGSWDGYKVYEFGDVNSVKVQKDKKGSELSIYEKQKVKSASREAKQISIRKNSQLLWNEEKVEKINRGTLMHEVLKQVKYAADVPKVLNKMFNEGLMNEKERKEMSDDIIALMNQDLIRIYFQPPFKVINERGFLSPKFTRIPDRVVIDGEQAIVIDYKTGKKKNEHIQQLNDYASELMKFGFKWVKKFLVYTEDKTVEEV
ncbi:MAG: UvrD-helicase domain-containing protein [Bacteroidetes bacterium]|nr:UvrD-helicase domain-containing protein [Bacteroidota bacterium]